MPKSNEQSKTSTDDIAALLIRPVADPDNVASPDQSGLIVEEASGNDDTTDNENNDNPEQSGLDGNDPDADDEDEQGSEDGDADGFTPIDDEDTLEVLVDGEMVEMTIKQLKKAASGEGAIEKRLQQATERMKEATALHGQRTQALERIAQEERDLQATLADLDDQLFQPLIKSAPSTALQQTDPSRYQRLFDAYTKDQDRIAAAKNAVSAKLQDVQTRRKERLEAYGADAAKVIVQLIPELADPAKSAAVMTSLRETATAYGYTDAEMASALDPRMFHLIRDAMAYKQLIGKNRETSMKVADVKAKAAQAPRRLRSGGLKNAKSSTQKAHQQVRDKAKSTGKVDDVAALIMKSS